MSYSNDEKETTCVYKYISDTWTVYSCVPRHMNKLRKIGGVHYWKEEAPGADGELRLIAGKWKLKSNQLLNKGRLRVNV
ncbi:hypothetical protein BRE01_48490 [Brevibacillus reuszeri]|uniref:Uncharacterized protein n=1 Tax=Brevibacillus reuszeri TaxID=54915 RepID=A0A0K9YYS3_9BACL|nr:hypothetical protein [Brevibacillus reuszeri]KNB73792.1 hypothetical protein ADS79_07610 [Brevibacillus reuszeri]MED1860071.1 hypothetical protein [Brevibacillus reuszeri]GED71147.1 hypothetical protein BRE01_48490 [Brevibacillus reuszeri]